MCTPASATNGSLLPAVLYRRTVPPCTGRRRPRTALHPTPRRCPLYRRTMMKPKVECEYCGSRFYPDRLKVLYGGWYEVAGCAVRGPPRS